MKPSGMAKADFITGLVLIVFGALVVEESWRMPRLEYLGVHPLSVPGIVPGFLGAVLFIFGVILTIRAVRSGGCQLGVSQHVSGFWAKPGNRRLVLTGVLSMFYACVLLGRIPFWLATFLYVLAFILVFECKPDEDEVKRPQARVLVTALVIAAATAASVTSVFQYVFLVTLP